MAWKVKSARAALSTSRYRKYDTKHSIRNIDLIDVMIRDHHTKRPFSKEWPKGLHYLYIRRFYSTVTDFARFLG